jgi:hypothetical protein
MRAVERSSRFLLLVTLVTVTAGCGDGAGSGSNAPALISPPAGAVVDNGCAGGPDAAEWSFDWSDVPGAELYALQAWRTGMNLAIDRDDLPSSHFWDPNRGWMEDDELDHWNWRVRARVNGLWGGWSETRGFQVEPLGTDCSGPAKPDGPYALSPANDSVVDNGCSDGSNQAVWSFAWSDVPGAEVYALQVWRWGSSDPVIDRDDLSSTHFSNAYGGWVDDGHLDQWYWRVRARVNGVWSEWGWGAFQFEPLNTDCPGPAPSGVPNLISPTADAIVDNGCGGGWDPVEWSFDWSDVPGAEVYALQVWLTGAQTLFIDRNDLSSSDFLSVSGGWVPDDGLYQWNWRARARVNGLWGEWSETRGFQVEPRDTDCPGAATLGANP